MLPEREKFNQISLYIKEEWKELLFAIIFVAFCLFFIFEKIYEIRIDNLREQNNTYNSTVILLEKQKEKYREDALLIEETRNSVYAITSEQLKNDTLKMIKEIRILLRNYDAESNELSLEQFNAMRQAITDDQKQEIWGKYNSSASILSNNTMNDYEEKYKVSAIIFRDEILKRLPEAKSDDMSNYKFPTNPIGIGVVVDDLERLAKLL